jgi:hypothetical protein
MAVDTNLLPDMSAFAHCLPASDDNSVDRSASSFDWDVGEQRDSG